MSIYYVRASGGNDGNTGLSFSDAWATIEYATNNTSNGDYVLICADAAHDVPITGLTFDLAGSNDLGVHYIGANATGTIDGTKAIIRGDNLFSSNYSIINLPTAANTFFKYIHLTTSKKHGVHITSNFNLGSVVFDTCKIEVCPQSGIYSEEGQSGKGIYILNTEIHSCGAYGIHAYSSNYGGFKIINCKIHDNTNYGIFESDNQAHAVIIGNQIYRNGSSGIYSIYLHGSIIMNNVLFENTGSGLHLPSSNIKGIVFINNIMKDNSGYGINVTQTGTDQFSYISNNCSYNNTSGAININGGILPGDGNITSDPLFTSEIIGSEVFTLQSGSPCLNAGFGYNG